MNSIEVLFSPADFSALPQRDLSNTLCVVLDVFRATSSMITALANGAAGVIPVGEIPEALAIRSRDPAVLLAGERDGLRIRATLTGGIDFDLGNSPREFTKERVAGKTVVTTTTNGTRALQSCAHAKSVLVAAFLNLKATGDFIARRNPAEVLIVCSGTLNQPAYEDTLCAGGLCKLLGLSGETSDSVFIARRLFELAEPDLPAAASQSRNGRRLLANPELCDDVSFCLQRDVFPLVAGIGSGGRVEVL